MKIVLFVGELLPHTQELWEYLKQNGFVCLKTVTSDEIDQVGQQNGMALLIFSDASFAYRFLGEYSWSAFPYYNACYVPKKPILNPDIEKKLASRSLSLFYPATRDKLLNALNKFRPAGESSDTGEEEIEFVVQEQIKKR